MSNHYDPVKLEHARKLAMDAASKATLAKGALVAIIKSEGTAPEYLTQSVRETLAEAREFIEMAEAQL